MSRALPSQPVPRRSEAGFTLTEALVAVTLLALIATAVVPVLRGSIGAHARLTETSAQAVDHAALERTLRSVLTHSVQIDEIDSFVGDSDAFSLYTQPPGATTPLYFTLTSGEDGVLLIVRDAEGGRRQEELTRLTDYAGVFYYGQRDTAAPRWYRDWDGRTMPRLVVLDFEPLDNGTIQRIEIALGAEAVLACDYDSGLQACREGI